MAKGKFGVPDNFGKDKSPRFNPPVKTKGTTLKKTKLKGEMIVPDNDSSPRFKPR